MAAYAKNHIATASYLKGWTTGSGHLSRVLIDGSNESELKRPDRVGFRRRFFADPNIAMAAERRFGVYESEGISALRRLTRTWPPTESIRLDIAKLIAVHMLRNPASAQRTLWLSNRQIQNNLEDYRNQLTDERCSDLLVHLTSESFLVEHMLDMIPKQASLLASMHWTLLEFNLPLLATSDQPVSVVPLLPDGAVAHVAAAPSTGYLMTEEVRFAVDPNTALLLTWLNDVEPAQPFSVDDDYAAELNRAVIAQADREWFHHPDRRSTRLKREDLNIEACGSLGHQLIPEYSTEYAIESPRRIHASELINHMIQNQITDRFLVARVRRADA